MRVPRLGRDVNTTPAGTAGAEEQMEPIAKTALKERPTKSESSTTPVQCPLCGRRFDESTAGCYDGCVLRRHCKLIMCPHCRYEFAHESTAVNLVSRIVQWVADRRRRVAG